MNHSTPGLPVHHQLPEFTKTHVHWIGDAIQQSHPPSSPYPPAFNLSQHHGLFQWVSSSHQVAKVLESQLQHQSFKGLVGSPCSPRDSQESSPTPQFKSINSLVLSFLYGPSFIPIHNHQGSPRTQEWVAYPFSRGPSWPRNQTRVSCTVGKFSTSWATREALLLHRECQAWFEDTSCWVRH